MKVFLASLVAGLAMASPVYGQASHAQKARMDDAVSSRLAYVTHPLERVMPLTGGTELIADGGFEKGGTPDAFGFATVSSAWAWQSSGAFASTDPRYHQSMHTGAWCLYFDLGPSVDRLSQTVIIPAGDAATLSFWLKVGANALGSSSVFDSLTIDFRDTAGNLLGNVASYHASDAVGHAYLIPFHSFT